MSLSASPRIAGLKTRAVRVLLPEPHITASGTLAESPLVLTDVMCDDGSVGHSIVFTYTPAALKPTAELIDNLAPMIVGQAAAPLEIDALFARHFRLLGQQGLVMMATAAIEMALWDAAARRANTSLVRMLGAQPRPIPAYGAVSYEAVHGSAGTAEKWARRGFKGVKAKIGYPTLAEDGPALRAQAQCASARAASRRACRLIPLPSARCAPRSASMSRSWSTTTSR